MNTILTEDDEVKFRSYCPKHSGLDAAEYRDSGGEEECIRDKKRRIGRMREEEEEEEDAAASCLSASVTSQVNSRTSGGADALSSHQQEKRVNLRKLKLEAMEEEFYLFVQVEEVARHLKLSAEAADFLYQYWKLKRKANFNQPLLTPKKDEEDSLARREQEVLRCRLQLFTHLRQDLERVSSSSTSAQQQGCVCPQLFHCRKTLKNSSSSGPEPDLHGDPEGEDEALHVEGPRADLPTSGPPAGPRAPHRSVR